MQIQQNRAYWDTDGAASAVGEAGLAVKAHMKTSGAGGF